MMREIAEFAAGLAINAFTLLDVFSTILVPGPTRVGIRVAALLSRLVLPAARRFARPIKGPGTRPSNSFAPLLFLLATLFWLLLLLAGFGLMFHACAPLFRPHLNDFADALYVAGSSLLTLGVSEVDAIGLARWLILAAALSGFGVITATVSFIIQVQAGLQQREPQVLSLSGVAGRPPTGIGILESYAALGLERDLPRFFDTWRHWANEVLHSHVSYPVLCFFHSADAESDWLAALGAVLDAATMLIAFGGGEGRGEAVLMHRSGARAAAMLCDVFALEGDPGSPHDPADFALLHARYAAAGYPADAPESQAIPALIALRTDYVPRIRALSHHFGADRSRLLPRRGR